jgi:hypothetical protein
MGQIRQQARATQDGQTSAAGLPVNLIHVPATHIAQAGQDLESHVDEAQDRGRNVNAASELDARWDQHEDKDRDSDDHRRQIREAQPGGVQQREESSEARQSLRDNASLPV